MQHPPVSSRRFPCLSQDKMQTCAAAADIARLTSHAMRTTRAVGLQSYSPAVPAVLQPSPNTNTAVPAVLVPPFQPGTPAVPARLAPAPAPSRGVIGGGRDAHGCLVAAGYSWCPSTGQCQRPWETRCSSTPVDNHGCKLAAGELWCPITGKCQKFSENPCVPAAPSVPTALDPLEPAQAAIPMNPDGPVTSVCDFGAPFFCTAPPVPAGASVPAVFSDDGLLFSTPYAAGAVSAGGAAQWYASGHTEPNFGFNPATSPFGLPTVGAVNRPSPGEQKPTPMLGAWNVA